MYTDKFLSVPIKMCQTSLSELTGVENWVDAWMKLDPNEISNYKPSYDDDNEDAEVIHLTLKNGYSTMVYLSPEEFELLLNSHQGIV
jgi:hypothetical protein